ncbi:MAG: hypothetical protein JW776_15440 [Candidatus Lokiarchaeota archaeon]|nr:hypothetical protein [Candidatus Lokiarchaeota archaeon]
MLPPESVAAITRIGSIFRDVIGILLLIVTLLFLIRSIQKKTGLMKKLTAYFFLYFLAVVATALSKYVFALPFEPLTGVIPSEYIYQFLRQDQLFKVIVFIANIIYYRFYTEIYETSAGKERIGFSITVYIVAAIGIGVAFYPLSVDIWELATAGVLLIHSLMLYIPFTVQSYRIFKRAEPDIKPTLFALFIHSFITTLVWVAIVADVIEFEVTGQGQGIAFYILWSLVAIAGITAYIGYTNPAWYVKLFAKSQK